MFKLRSKMFPIKANFRSLYKNNPNCSLRKDPTTTENEQHLLVCPIITNNMNLREDIKSAKFEDIFSNEHKQEKIAKVLKQISEIYERKKRK